ncbi:beta-glucuronosyltransferase GlcAT14A isoform X2 [Diospyros lotus]|uniref:beta-glucuronosyltransferase GlcAT14A isoform X2 n=1 Tax=Diospyros lotus TaxID=55363 RepID=UPI00224F1539|nr:beta-glucuronosyltransferase GlcAT14A isoform X2 [Diospyros lotus]
MQSPAQPPPPSTAAVAGDNRVTTLYCIIAASLFSLLFVFSLSSTPHTRPPPPLDPYLFPDRQSQPSSARRHRLFIPNSVDPPPPPPPSIAYLISGSDPHRILRLLLAVYHPRNHYLLHLDLSAPQSDRQFLAVTVRSIAVFRAAQNVNVIGKADFAYPKGSSPLSSTLHGASILLRLSANWDWFINLSVADYPLVTQDDLLHILSYLPKDLNFVNHTSYIGWKESRSLKRIIVDPGLYISEKIWMFYASQKRELPDAFRLFMGSSSAILSRKVIEFCILGTDNLPRTLLMYLSNTPSAASVYFPTVLCNSRQFSRTTINHGLCYASFDNNQEPRAIKSEDLHDLMRSGAAFASPFPSKDPVLDHIDKEILNRSPGKPLPGGWCLGESKNDTCDIWGDANILSPGPGARRLENLFIELLSNGTFRSHQCIVK